MSISTPNILFIMYDQLRFDYLSCAGHPNLETPNIDRIAEMGVRFTNCYVQSPVCGASRMSTYTGRYVSSHGAAWNNYPLNVGEQTLGDHLRKLDVASYLIGKTHMMVDGEGMDRLGISRDSIIGARVSECGFDAYVRDDGLWAEGPDGFYDKKRSPYNEYLRSKGYEGDNPWANHANAGVDDDGDIATGWLMGNADKAANVAEEDSETPWLTTQAIEFLEGRDPNERFLCHLSYIKPHWPYIVPAPYHAMYKNTPIPPANRSDVERINPHPVYEQFMNNKIGKAFHRDDVRNTVIPAYMGLIKQCDDQIGRLLVYLESSGQLENTMIIITSDHGDYLGDHWMGEKDLFHAPSVKVPLIIYDPRPAANSTRGTTCDALVEAIDLAATAIETQGGETPEHIVEGRSLLPFLHGETPQNWREFAVSEYDYSATSMARNLALAPRDARIFMVATKDWKLIHFEGGFRPMLFDLVNDPDELTDLGNDPAHQETIDALYDMLFAWARRPSQRTTISDKEILRRRHGGGSERKGILLGTYDENDTAPDNLSRYVGKAMPIPTPDER
jgi:arylsulfatase A-like enzyme